MNQAAFCMLGDTDTYEFIGTSLMGGQLYFEATDRYYFNEYGSSIVYYADDAFYRVEGMPTRPIYSPDRSKFAYITEAGFEVLGNLVVYDTLINKIWEITHFEYSDELGVKDVIWIDNQHLLLIVGYNMGTSTRGGDLYLYSKNGKLLQRLTRTDDFTETVDIESKLNKIIFLDLHWGENHMEYSRKRYAVDMKDFMIFMYSFPEVEIW